MEQGSGGYMGNFERSKRQHFGTFVYFRFSFFFLALGETAGEKHNHSLAMTNNNIHT